MRPRIPGLLQRDPPVPFDQLLAAMADAGVSNWAVSKSLAVPLSTVQRWASGATPNYEDGRAILALVAHLEAFLKGHFAVQR